MRVLCDGYLLRDDGVIEINPDVVYPLLQEELGLADEQLDQYWLEVIFQFAKLDAIDLVEGTRHDRRAQNIALQIHVLPGRSKQRWQLKRYPVGRGAVLASKGLEARGHYLRLRGYVPGTKHARSKDMQPRKSEAR